MKRIEARERRAEAARARRAKAVAKSVAHAAAWEVALAKAEAKTVVKVDTATRRAEARERRAKVRAEEYAWSEEYARWRATPEACAKDLAERRAARAQARAWDAID